MDDNFRTLIIVDDPDQTNDNFRIPAAVQAKKTDSYFHSPENEDIPNRSESAYTFGSHVKDDFGEIFSTPVSYADNELGRTVGDKVVNVGFLNLFTYTKAGLFYVISVLLGFVSSLVWGVVLGVNNLFLTWFAQPTAKLLFIWLRLIGILLRAVTRTFLDPVCQSVGLSLSTIRSKLSLNGRCGTLLADAIRRA